MATPDSSPGPPIAQTFKILVLGDSGVGKTSIIQYYTEGKANPNMISTIGVDYSDVIISVRGVRVKLRVWDTAGQERFHTFTKQFFRGSQGVILVYDITSLHSFTMLSKWIQMLSDSGLSDLDAVIVGNKSDLEECRNVPIELPTALSSDKGCPHILTSSLTGSNIKKAFYKMAESLIHSHNIFVPGVEAAAIFDGNDDYASISQTLNNERSIILSKEEYEKGNKKKKQCCHKN